MSSDRTSPSSRPPDPARLEQALAALSASEELFRQLTGHLDEVFWLAEPGEPPRFIYVSPAFEKLWPASCEELLNDGWKWLEAVHPEDRDQVAAMFLSLLRGDCGRELEYRLVLPSGSIRWIRARGFPILDREGRAWRFSGLCQDITSQRLTEQALRRSRHELALKNRLSEIMLTVTDERMYSLVLLVALDQLESPLGYFGYHDREGVLVLPPGAIGDPGRGMVNPDRLAIAPERRPRALLRALESGQPFRSHRPLPGPQEGRPPLTSLLTVPLVSGERTIGELAVANRRESYTDEDLRQLELAARHLAPLVAARLERERLEARRRESEERLRRSEELYRTLVESSIQGVLIMQREQVVFLNPAGREILGLEPERVEALRPSDIFELIHPEDRERVHRRFLDWLEGKDREARLEFRLQNCRSREMWLETLGHRIEYQGRPSVQVTFIDISERRQADEERRQLEQQLFQAQKMESIGRLAGGMAHDFNNILSSIMGWAEMLKMMYPDPRVEEGQVAEVIIRGAQRAAELTRQLLGFARGGKYNPQPVLVNEMVREAVSVSEKIFEKRIELVLDLAEGLPTVEADRNQLLQVLTNLLINARDAMPSGGRIVIRSSLAEIGPEYLERHPCFQPGSYLRLTVTDNGMGMSREVLGRIFEPFFTTKEQSKGTGLGLATVYGIVRNHGGQVNAYSEPGQGSTFTVYLPASGKALVDDLPERTLLAGEGLILLVEDEDEVRGLVRKQLEVLGYRTLIARDGVEAVELFRERNEQIDLVVLDLIMPRMAGTEAFAELRRIDPAAQVLLISGFSQNYRANELLAEGALGFLQKPFTLNELSRELGRTLGSGRRE